MKKGKIIAISGMDASGKSTVSEIIQKELKKRKISYIVTRQPCICIKEWDCFRTLLKNENVELDFRTIGGLIAWGRINTQLKEVEPALNRGIYVICERYILDIIAWSYFRNAPNILIESWIAPLRQEDLLFYCNSDPKVISERLNMRGESGKVGEDTEENIEKVISLYIKNAKKRNAVMLETNDNVLALKQDIKLSLAYLEGKNE